MQITVDGYFFFIRKEDGSWVHGIQLLWESKSDDIELVTTKHNNIISYV